MTTTKSRRHALEQVGDNVCENERMLATSRDLAEVLRHLETTDSTLHRWLHRRSG